MQTDDIPPQIEPESPFAAVEIDQEAFLFLALGVVGSILASMLALVTARMGTSTLASEIFWAVDGFADRKLFFTVAPTFFLVLALPLVMRGRAPAVPVHTAAVFAVLLLLAAVHEYRLRTEELLLGDMNEFILYRYSFLVLSFGAVALIQNRKNPTKENAFMFCFWIVVWLFGLAFPRFAEVWLA
jgi:hypothetical protein